MKNTLKILFLLVISMIFTVSNVCAKEIKFVQVTDSHFSGIQGDYSQDEVAESEIALKKTIEDINTLKDLDFVVFTGDNIDKANSEDLKSFIKYANGLKVPYYMVIGNHEVFKSQDFTKKDYLKTASKYSKCFHETKPNYTFEKKGIVFVVVDGAKEVIPGPAGYYKKETLKWLDKTLTKYKNQKVVILQHFPIVEPYYNRSHTTYNIKDYEAVLAKHNNVIAIVSGHYHSNGEKMKDGIYHVSTPALVQGKHDYKIIEIELKDKKNPQIFTQLRHAE